MYEKKPCVGIEAGVEREGHEGVECVRKADLEHRAGEVVHEVLDGQARVAGDTWSTVMTEARRNGKVEREWQWQRFEERSAGAVRGGVG